MTLVACTVLYGAVAIVLSALFPAECDGDAAPVVNALKRLSMEPGGRGSTGYGFSFCWARCWEWSLQFWFSNWAGAHLVCDVEGPAAA